MGLILANAKSTNRRGWSVQQRTCRFMKIISVLALNTMFHSAQATGIPTHDLTGTFTLSKTNIALEPGQVVNLVSINSTCHYTC